MVKKKKGRLFFNLITIFLVLIIGLLSFVYFIDQKNLDKPFSFWGYQPMVVLSGSMEPALKTGDIVVVKKITPELIKEGDIITFQVAEDVIITHRVKEIVSTVGGVSFKTKGDANRIADGSLINGRQLLGSVIFRIPYGGHMANFIRSKWGFALLIVVPVIILFYSEVKKVFYLR